MEIEKEIVREVARSDKPLPEKIYRSQSTNQEGVCSVQRTDLCFAICRFSQVKFITTSHLTHNLFFYYRKRGSASYIVREVLSVREREIQRETDGSDVTIVALKLAMNSHFPLPKIRTIGDIDELTLFLAKNSHFSFLP